MTGLDIVIWVWWFCVSFLCGFWCSERVFQRRERIARVKARLRQLPSTPWS